MTTAILIYLVPGVAWMIRDIHRSELMAARGEGYSRLVIAGVLLCLLACAVAWPMMATVWLVERLTLSAADRDTLAEERARGLFPERRSKKP